MGVPRVHAGTRRPAVFRPAVQFLGSSRIPPAMTSGKDIQHNLMANVILGSSKIFRDRGLGSIVGSWGSLPISSCQTCSRDSSDDSVHVWAEDRSHGMNDCPARDDREQQSLSEVHQLSELALLAFVGAENASAESGPIGCGGQLPTGGSTSCWRLRQRLQCSAADRHRGRNVPIARCRCRSGPMDFVPCSPEVRQGPMHVRGRRVITRAPLGVRHALLAGQ